MFTARITMTGKGYHPKSQWSTFGQDTIHANTLQALKEKLQARYGTAWKRKRPMYCDKKDGQTVRTGWVVGFRADDISHVPVQRWLQQDWISMHETTNIEWSVT